MEKLTHLIYASNAAPGLDASHIEPILQSARRNNAQQSVTGMLLYTAGNFFQVLEGDEANVLNLFTIIAADRRHTDVIKIIHEPIPRRAFSEWTMGFAEIARSELTQIDGLNDFFEQGAVLTNLPPGRAKKLLSAFAQGRWRARVAL